MFKDNKKFVAESIFIKEALKKNLSLNEFLLLLYFDNSFDLVFDIKIISKALNMSEEQILEAYSSLMSKKIIKVKAEKDGYGKITALPPPILARKGGVRNGITVISSCRCRGGCD